MSASSVLSTVPELRLAKRLSTALVHSNDAAQWFPAAWMYHPLLVSTFSPAQAQPHRSRVAWLVDGAQDASYGKGNFAWRALATAMNRTNAPPLNPACATS